MGNWQDWFVTGIAAVAGVLVVWRTLGSWKDSKPGSKNTPACDHCAVAEIVKEQSRDAQRAGKSPT